MHFLSTYDSGCSRVNGCKRIFACITLKACLCGMGFPLNPKFSTHIETCFHCAAVDLANWVAQESITLTFLKHGIKFTPFHLLRPLIISTCFFFSKWAMCARGKTQILSHCWIVSHLSPSPAPFTVKNNTQQSYHGINPCCEDYRDIDERHVSDSIVQTQIAPM